MTDKRKSTRAGRVPVRLPAGDAALKEALEKFQGLKATGKPGAWAAKCQAHDDHKASLSLTLAAAGAGQQRLLLHCHAGCEWEALLEAHGITDAAALTFPTTSQPSTSAPKNGAAAGATVTPIHASELRARVVIAHAALMAERPFGSIPTTLQRRGIPEEMVEAAQLGLEGNALVFPYIRNGEPEWLKFRKRGDKAFWRDPKGGAEFLYGLDDLEDGKDAILTEGEFDKLSMDAAKAPCPAVSLPNGVGTATAEVLAPLTKCPRIYMNTDDDEAGNKAAAEAARRLGAGRCYRLTFPGHKDANDALQALGLRKFKALLAKRMKAAKPMGEASGTTDTTVYPSPPRKITFAEHRNAWAGVYGWKLPAPFNGALEFDVLKHRVTFGRVPDDVDDAVAAMRTLAGELGHRFTDADTHKALMAVARRHRFHPVAEQLTALPAWDGKTDWLDVLATKTLHLPAEDALSRALLRKTFIAAVARAMEPGCKVDTVCILLGDQGVLKSTFWEVAAGGPEFFSDTAVDLRNKDGLMQVQAVWFYEWSELETKRRSEESATKAFLSARVDKFRAPYARTVEEHRRGCIIVGTTNGERFLTDPTGARRYWPITLPKGTRLDLEWFRAHRDVVMAQALALYRKGEAWWLDKDSDLDKHLVARQQADHRVVDDLEERVLAAAANPSTWAGHGGRCSLTEHLPEKELARLDAQGLGVLQLAQLDMGRGATTDEILRAVYENSTHYIGKQGLHDRVGNILRLHGYQRKRWTLHPALRAEPSARWRHRDWPAGKRGNPNLRNKQKGPNSDLWRASPIL